MVIAATLILIAVATLMFLGWGWAFLKLFRLKEFQWPTTVAVGMAAVVFLGGLLNLARLAYPVSLAIIVAIGLVLALRAIVRFSRPPIVLTSIIAAIMIFTIATQLPPSIYNFHDDYQKYFAYPVRMIQTGTVFGSPLSAMGLQTLGAQAFLDGFVVAFFPIAYINGVDAVFGLFLCLILASQLTKDRIMSAVCVLSVVVINPQYVNISTLFCGSALMMAVVMVEDAAGLGLVYAALIAMKPICVVFVAVHLLTFAFMQAKAQLGSRFPLLHVLRTGLATAFFLLPWVLLHAPNYLAALRTHHPAPTPVPGDIDTDKLSLFSLEPLAYGSTAANYTLLVIALVVCGVLCRLDFESVGGDRSRWSRLQTHEICNRIPSAPKAIACSIIAVATYLIFIYILGPMQYGYEHGLRYFTPVAIALAPAVFGLTTSRPRWLPLIVAIIPLAAFGPSFRSRIVTELTTHSAASYAWLTKDPDYLEYNQRVLNGPERQDVKALQEKIPAGEPILAWINTPFYLDYRRNRIIDIDTAGIGVPWAAIPPAQYLMWDYDGFATRDPDEYKNSALNAGAGERKDSMRTLDFVRRLKSTSEKGVVLLDDEEIKIVRLGASAHDLR